MPDIVPDLFTEVSTKVIGEIPEIAMGNLLMSTSHALGNASYNAILAQQQGLITMQAVTFQGVNSLMNAGALIIGRIN
jgi:hypothetical protein